MRMSASHQSLNYDPHAPRGSSIREILSALFRRTGKARRLMPAQMILLVLDGCIQAAVPAVMGIIVDRLINDPGHFVGTVLPWLAVGVVGGSVLFYLVAYTHHFLGQRISWTLSVRFQVDLYEHLQRLSADFYQRTRVGEITSRLTNDINQGVKPMYHQCTQILWSLSVLIPASMTLAILSVKLLGIFLVVIIVFGIGGRIIIPRIRKLHRDVQDEAGRLNARITEDVTANHLIRAFAREDDFSEEMREHTSEYLSKALRSYRVSLKFVDLINTFLKILAPLSLLLLGSMLIGPADQGGITVGALVTAYGYWHAATQPVSSILNNITMLFTSFASVDRILEFFREHPRVKDEPDATPITVDRAAIQFEHVYFRYYDHHDSWTLNDVDFDVPGGDKVAIVGPSGAGKSTVAQLLLRFYDPQEGNIIIDGQNIRTVTQASLRNAIGLVMQDTIVMSTSLRDNMLLARPSADDDQIAAALKSAHAWEFVESLPEGLDTQLGERGTRLSGGQRQRIAIARVFLKDPRIVIFDEATSALDAITERQIQQAMQQLLAGRTAIIIAHRLSTVMHCDTILYVENGKVIAQGTHRELLHECPAYYHLCQEQSLTHAE